MAQCPACRHRFRTPEGEENEHDCPHCGYDGRPKCKVCLSYECECEPIVVPSDDCSVCGGELMLLGTLGHTTHYRCRNCGIDWSVQS